MRPIERGLVGRYSKHQLTISKESWIYVDILSGIKIDELEGYFIPTRN